MRSIGLWIIKVNYLQIKKSYLSIVLTQDIMPKINHKLNMEQERLVCLGLDFKLKHFSI